MPPVVAPWSRMMPRDRPIRTPPKTLANIGSMGWNEWIAATMSTPREVAAMAKREDSNRRPPRYFQLRRNRGMFSAMTAIPIGIAGTAALMIWPRPVMPPRLIWLGT